MATQPALAAVPSTRLKLEPLARFPNLRVLAWEGDTLYASRGYSLLSTRSRGPEFVWNMVGHSDPALWRRLSSRFPLGSRLFRNGFHALAIHPTGNLVAAVPGAIVTLRKGDRDFRRTHSIQRGTRPLHITATPDGSIFWGEYFDNPNRDQVHIYASADGGLSWDVAHTFTRNSIRHVHNLVYDRWERCLWIFTGDYGRECRILRASVDFRTVDEVIAGNQQARAVAAVVRKEGLFFASDTPLEQNFIYRLDRRGHVRNLQAIPSSSINACQNRDGIFFSTMIEPSEINRSRDVTIFGSAQGEEWNTLVSWKKDGWPMGLFQYGNAFLPSGENRTDLLAATTIAVRNADLQTIVWRTRLNTAARS